MPMEHAKPSSLENLSKQKNGIKGVLSMLIFYQIKLFSNYYWSISKKTIIGVAHLSKNFEYHMF
jgi:hypothetical protein